ncbi:MAG: extracellular solute-binding protein, partial [Acholeplasmatales bacterium]|nr:extracellular solute-binding protein [Acholeplasmatales bacterium]
MQRLIDSQYNPNHDIKVKLSAMPDQSKLTLSVAADNSPDVVLGLSSYIPYDLAIRGGVHDLTQFEDFYEVANRFPSGSLLSFVVSDQTGDRIYAIPETLDFNVVVYRDDIFNALEVNEDINSWDDLVAILPTLQRYGMNFYMPIAADNSTKWFYQTSSLLLQAGGEFYAEDGLSVAINSPEAIAGLELLTTLFTEKSL